MRVEYNENESAMSSGIELVTLSAWAEHLLSLADVPNANQLLNLDYELPVRRVFPCPECGRAVVLIEFAHNHERKIVDAAETLNGWIADVILGVHQCKHSNGATQ
jgi:hypothetical protein